MSEHTQHLQVQHSGGSRELIVVAKPGAGIRATPEGVRSVGSADAGSLQGILARANVTLTPLFGVGEEQLQREAAADGARGSVPDLSVYYHVDAPDADLDRLAAELREHDAIEAAYVKPAGEPPVAPMGAGVGVGGASYSPPDGATFAPRSSGTTAPINDMQPSADAAPAVTPDFTARQLYLGPAPVGVDAPYAATLPGGRGTGVNIIDCEWSWNRTHEDLAVNQGGVVVGAAGGNSDHGTAVLGVMGGTRDARGVTGICPDSFRRCAAFSKPSAAVIREAADKLSPGDLLLLEIHRAGPGASGVGQDGYIAVEWWPDDYDAIRYAISRGVIVVEAAGNGFRNLDDPIYDTPAPGFPAGWSNPFRRGARDSGAILVGAGAPPPGTHGRNWGADRSRLDFSNYGAAVDAQGWGREVTTTGYGDLQGGGDANVWYTDRFSGTSSASPIVTGALAATQGVLRARGQQLLTPARARLLLRQTGSPQQDEPGRPRTQRIGNRPDLRQLIAAATTQGTAKWAGLFRPGQRALWFDTRPDLASFNADVSARFAQGLYLTDVSTFLEGGQTRWAGIFRPGSGALWFDTRPDLASFNTQVSARFAQGLYLTNVTAWVEGGQTRWAGVFRPGSGALWFDTRPDLAAFNTQVSARFAQGLYLTNVTAWVEAGQTRWAGIFRPGSGALWFDTRPDLPSFNADVVARFAQGLYLTDATAYTEGGQTRWAGIFRPGSGRLWFDTRPDLASFNADVSARFAQGLYLERSVALG
jgi:hypothetical protein